MIFGDTSIFNNISCRFYEIPNSVFSKVAFGRHLFNEVRRTVKMKTLPFQNNLKKITKGRYELHL